MKLKALFIISFLCTLIFTSCKEDINIKESTLKDEIANQEYVKIIEDNVSNFPENTQVAIAIIDGASTEFIGVINKNNVLRRIENSDKIFEIGSITKVFTSICLSHLIATDEASLTETLQSQFDFPIPEGATINLLQLANHTSGLPRLPNNVDEIVNFNLQNPFANYSINNLESYYQNHIQLNASSGTQYEYSNLGVGTLGYILSKKRGVSYEELLQSLILEPLQMTNSTTLLSNVDASKLVIGQDEEGNTTPNWDFTDAMAGTGSIKSSLVDMEKFVRKNFENDAVYNLPQEVTFNITQDQEQNTSMGLGWEILETGGFKVHRHDGGTGGYRSYLMMDKSNRKAVLVLSNLSVYHDNVENIDDLAADLLENILL